VSAHEAVYDVRGMTCAACAKRVERAIGKVAGVENASVDLVRERARVLGAPREPELIAAVAKAGYELVPHARADARRDTSDARTVAAAVLAALLLAVDLFAPRALGTSTPWIALAVASIVTFGLGAPIFARAARLALTGEASMETLIAVGSAAALVGSVISLRTGHGGAHGHSDASTAALVIAVVLVGKSIEARAKRRSAAALDEAAAQDRAPIRITRHDATSEVPPSELRAGDVMHVAPFAIVPADGTLESNDAYVDESLVTGESRPVHRAQGDVITSGSLNGATPLRVVVTAAGIASARGRLEAETAAALAKTPREAALADRASRWIVPLVLAVASITFVVRVALGEATLDALRIAIGVVVVACPCALGLATPAALVAALTRATREGIVVRDGERFLALARVTRLCLDKTGTLTEGRPRTTAFIAPSPTHDERTVLMWVASVEADSEHPIGHALFASAMERGIAALPARDVKALPGRGIEGVVDGHRVLVEVLEAADDAWSADVRDQVTQLRADGHSISIVRIDDEAHTLLAVRDRMRASSPRALETLRATGVRVEVLSGDHESAALAVAREVGLERDRVHAGLRPDEKRSFVERAMNTDVVAMVGDGVNDAPALATADVGIAIGRAAGAALRSAALALLDGDLARIDTARALARITRTTIRGNLAWAFAYNGLALPLAAFGALDRLGGPAVSAAAMAGSSIAVLVWSLRINYARLSR
jgi:Cu+-exporting ATPase